MSTSVDQIAGKYSRTFESRGVDIGAMRKIDEDYRGLGIALLARLAQKVRSGNLPEGTVRVGAPVAGETEHAALLGKFRRRMEAVHILAPNVHTDRFARDMFEGKARLQWLGPNTLLINLGEGKNGEDKVAIQNPTAILEMSPSELGILRKWMEMHNGINKLDTAGSYADPQAVVNTAIGTIKDAIAGAGV